MTKKAEAAAEHVLAYAQSKQLRGGWGAISECYSKDELYERLCTLGIESKTEALAWARGVVKLTREQEAEVKAAA